MRCTSEGKIFPAAERGRHETSRFRSLQTFKYGWYRQPHKQPFGPLAVLNEETLAGGESRRLPVAEPAMVLLLPVVGGLCIDEQNKAAAFIEAGQALLVYRQKGEELSIRNPYEHELVSYLHLQFRCPHLDHHGTVFHFSPDEHKNRFVDLFPGLHTNGFYLKAAIGKFEGRKEAMYPLANGQNGVMAFVLQGAFEVENRLLEAKDGLAVWKTAQIELEALSNEAIILLLEVALQNQPETCF